MGTVRPSPLQPKPDRGKWRNQSLFQFLEQVYLPLEAADATRPYKSLYRRTVRLFGQFLGRPPVMADLTPDQLKRFVAWLPLHESIGQQRQTKNRLRRVWRYAAMLGFAGEIDAQRPPALPSEPPVMTPGTLSHFFETVYVPTRLVGTNANATNNVRREIARFGRFIGHPVMFSELNDANLAAYLNHRIEVGLQHRSANNIRTSINAVWRLAYDRGLISTMPGIRKLRESTDEPDSWSEDEFKRILSACSGLASRRPIDGVSRDSLMRAVLLLAYWTGLRRGTLWKLRWCDVDVANRWVSVPGRVMKNNRGKKFRIGKDAAKALTAIRIDGADNVLPAVGWGQFYSDFDAVLDAAGVPPSQRKGMSKLHKIRRTTGTLVAVRQGVGAASSLLGHSDQQVTMRYIDPSKLPGNDVTGILPTLADFNAVAAAGTEPGRFRAGVGFASVRIGDAVIEPRIVTHFELATVRVRGAVVTAGRLVAELDRVDELTGRKLQVLRNDQVPHRVGDLAAVLGLQRHVGLDRFQRQRGEGRRRFKVAMVSMEQCLAVAHVGVGQQDRVNQIRPQLGRQLARRVFRQPAQCVVDDVLLVERELSGVAGNFIRFDRITEIDLLGFAATCQLAHAGGLGEPATIVLLEVVDIGFAAPAARAVLKPEVRLQDLHVDRCREDSRQRRRRKGAADHVVLINRNRSRRQSQGLTAEVDQ